MQNRALPPYNFYLQEEFNSFWKSYDFRGRKVLFIFGIGFDPRCVPALEGLASEMLRANASMHTLAVRFTNIFDEVREINEGYTNDMLARVRVVTAGLRGALYQHTELEVRLFDSDRKVCGDGSLVAEIQKRYGDTLQLYTDIVIDISALPRPLADSVIAYFWRARSERQNIFATLTEVESKIKIDERSYTQPTYMYGGPKPADVSHRLWIPILGGRIGRFEHIYQHIKPSEVYPIIPFPTANPRYGDEIFLEAYPTLSKWSVQSRDIMYASGDVPFDVFRKIYDLHQKRSQISEDSQIILSALSGRSLSLGVLLAALWLDLPMCHAQPTTYVIEPEELERLRVECGRPRQTIYWLAGTLYETRAGASP
jgi:hypothetical protein